jgi:hypothetical protein
MKRAVIFMCLAVAMTAAWVMEAGAVGSYLTQLPHL